MIYINIRCSEFLSEQKKLYEQKALNLKSLPKLQKACLLPIVPWLAAYTTMQSLNKIMKTSFDVLGGSEKDGVDKIKKIVSGLFVRPPKTVLQKEQFEEALKELGKEELKQFQTQFEIFYKTLVVDTEQTTEQTQSFTRGLLSLNEAEREKLFSATPQQQQQFFNEILSKQQNKEEQKLNQ